MGAFSFEMFDDFDTKSTKSFNFFRITKSKNKINENVDTEE